MKMKKLNIYIIGLLTLMLCGIQSCALESEVFDEITRAGAGSRFLPPRYTPKQNVMSATWLREMLILHSRITITEVCIM